MFTRQKFTHLLINAGKKDGISPKRLMRDIFNAAGSPDMRIGKIEVMNNTSLLEADSRFTKQVLQALRSLTINGRYVSVEVDRKEGNRQRPENRRIDRNSTKFRKKDQGRQLYRGSGASG